MKTFCIYRKPPGRILFGAFPTKLQHVRQLTPPRLNVCSHIRILLPLKEFLILNVREFYQILSAYFVLNKLENWRTIYVKIRRTWPIPSVLTKEFRAESGDKMTPIVFQIQFLCKSLCFRDI